MNNPPGAVSYVRVSTLEQVDGASLDTQEMKNQQWALGNNVLLLRTFREEGASAKTANRPVLKEMLEYLGAHRKEVQYLVVYQQDRLSRNVEDYIELTRKLKALDIEIKDAGSLLETRMSDKYINYMRAITAEMDNDVKSERVTENMKRHAADGYRMAKAPYGLRNVRDVLGHSTVEPISEVSDTIAYLLNEFSKGTWTIKELIEVANQRGLRRPNGKPMNHMFMGKVLRQSLYAGLEKNKHTSNELVESVFPGIIDKQTYYRNQQLLKKRSETKTEGYVIDNEDYPLRRFVKCSTCGRSIRGSASTNSRGKAYPRYHCDKCKKAAVLPSELHKQFIQLLDDVKPNEVTTKLLKTMIVRVWNDELKTLREERKRAQERIEKLEEHKVNAIDKLVSDVISKNEKISIHRKADEQILGLAAAVAKLSSQIGTKGEAIDFALDYMDNAPMLWQQASPDMRLVYQSMVFPEGLTYDFYQKKFGTPKLSALYTLANMKTGTEVPDNSTMVISRRIELRLPG